MNKINALIKETLGNPPVPPNVWEKVWNTRRCLVHYIGTQILDFQPTELYEINLLLVSPMVCDILLQWPALIKIYGKYKTANKNGKMAFSYMG